MDEWVSALTRSVSWRLNFYAPASFYRLHPQRRCRFRKSDGATGCGSFHNPSRPFRACCSTDLYNARSVTRCSWAYLRYHKPWPARTISRFTSPPSWMIFPTIRLYRSRLFHSTSTFWPASNQGGVSAAWICDRTPVSSPVRQCPAGGSNDVSERCRIHGQYHHQVIFIRP